MKFDIKKLPAYFLALFVLATVLFIILAGVSFWLFVFLLIWGLFYSVFIIQKLKFSFIRYEWIWIFFGILILLTVGLIYLPKSQDKATTSSTEKPLTAAECAPIAEKYDGKVINVTSDGLKGRISIRITDKNTCKAEIVHQYLFDANLEQGPTYGYMGYTSEKDDSENRKLWNGNGAVAAVYKNSDTLPTDPFQVGSGEYYSNGTNGVVNRFYVGYSEEPYLSENRYKELTSENIIYVIDGRSYLVTTNEPTGGTSTTSDEEKAAKEGPIVKTFLLKFSE